MKPRIKDWKPPLIEDPGKPPVIKNEKVGWIKARWALTASWFNGKKMLIGATVLVAGLVVGGPWGILLKTAGGAITTYGGAHKIGKLTSKYGKKGEFGNKEFLELVNDLIVLIIQIFHTIKALGSKIKSFKSLKGGQK